MSWKEVCPGRFERPFDTLEAFYRGIAAGGAELGKEHWTISIGVKFCMEPSVSEFEKVMALRRAWTMVRADYPQIAAVAQGQNFVYEVPDVAALESWLADTFIVASATTTAKDLYATFKPSTYATLHYLPKSSEVLLHSSHWRIDGIGAMHLLNHLFEGLAKPRTIEFGDEGKNLSPGLDEAAQMPTEVSPEGDKAATDLLMEFAGNLPSIGIPMSPTSAMPGPTRRAEIELSPHLSSTIIAACKSHGCTVTTATHAAIISATQQLDEKTTPAKPYTSLTIFDLRRHCPHPYNTPAHPVSVYHTGLPMTIAPSSFSETIEQLKKYYSRSFDPAKSSIMSYLSSYVRQLGAALTSPPPPDAPPPTQPVLSSLGIIDNYIASSYGGEKVCTEGFWLGVEMLTPGVMCHVWTRGGRMVLSGCFNESFYAEGYVKDFLARVKGVLVEGLGVVEEGGVKDMNAAVRDLGLDGERQNVLGHWNAKEMNVMAEELGVNGAEEFAA